MTYIEFDSVLDKLVVCRRCGIITTARIAWFCEHEYAILCNECYLAFQPQKVWWRAALDWIYWVGSKIEWLFARVFDRMFQRETHHV